jgi:hypothetical protein
MMQLNHRISAYARRAMYSRFDFIDNRTSRVLGHANDLVEVYEGGELLDADILAAVDSKEVDPLDLDPATRWLRDMRTCRTLEVRDLLYGRDIGSLSTLAETLSRDNIVLFPQVRNLIVSAKIVKQILAQDEITRRGSMSKEISLGFMTTLFHASRPTLLCLQDSAIFSPPPIRSTPFVFHQLQEEINGRLIPVRRGHMSHNMTQWIEGMDELEEIRYHAVDPTIPIFPKKGIKHIVSFKSEPPPSHAPTTPAGPSSSAFSMFSNVELSYIDHIIQAIQDIITRSLVPLPDPGPPPFTEHETDDSANDEGQEGEREAKRPEIDNPPHYSNGTDEGGEKPGRKQSTWHFILPFSRAQDGHCAEAEEIEGTIEEWVEERYMGVLKDEILDGISFGLLEDRGKCGVCDCKS